MQVVDHYPGDAAKGADYLTGAAQRDIVVDGSKSVEEGGIRRERVIITDLYLDHEGRVCLSETSVQHMANLLGMYDGDHVNRIIAENAALRSEVSGQQAVVEGYQNRIAGLEAEQAVQYVGLDGKPYATKEGAAAANQPGPVSITPVDAPETDEASTETAPPKRSDEDQAEIDHLHREIARLEDERDAAKAGDGGGASSPPEDGKSTPPPKPPAKKATKKAPAKKTTKKASR